MRNATLLFLIKKDNDTVTDICLAMKKRGFGAGRYNGVGGKVELEESIEQAVAREAKEEIGIVVKEMKKYAEIVFTFPHNPAWDQVVHAYLAHLWTGIPTESEEMNPKWFAISDIPYTEMWPADIYWLPGVLEGKEVRARISFGEGDSVLGHEITII